MLHVRSALCERQVGHSGLETLEAKYLLVTSEPTIFVGSRHSLDDIGSGSTHCFPKVRFSFETYTVKALIQKTLSLGQGP